MTSINTQGISTQTVSITDYTEVAAKVYKVIVAYTGNHTRASISAAIGAQLGNLAAPVEGSFRTVKDNVAVGFIRANREIRAVDDIKQIRAGYKVMSSSNGQANILMDNKDRSLWEVKETAGSKYLARHGVENLAELVSAALNPRNDVPGLAQLSMATAAPREFVAFASASGDMDYGYCVAASEAKAKIKVVSAHTGIATVIPTSAVAGVYSIPIRASAHKKVLASGISREDKNQEIEYYTRLYSYDRAYLDEVIQNIEESATA